MDLKSIQAQGGLGSGDSSSYIGNQYSPNPGTAGQSPCPHCGYCPHCGRGGYQTYPYWPYQPYQPWTVPMSGGTTTGYPLPPDSITFTNKS